MIMIIFWGCFFWGGTFLEIKSHGQPTCSMENMYTVYQIVYKQTHIIRVENIYIHETSYEFVICMLIYLHIYIYSIIFYVEQIYTYHIYKSRVFLLFFNGQTNPERKNKPQLAELPGVPVCPALRCPKNSEEVGPFDEIEHKT